MVRNRLPSDRYHPYITLYPWVRVFQFFHPPSLLELLPRRLAFAGRGREPRPKDQTGGGCRYIHNRDPPSQGASSLIELRPGYMVLAMAAWCWVNILIIPAGSQLFHTASRFTGQPSPLHSVLHKQWILLWSTRARLLWTANLTLSRLIILI